MSNELSVLDRIETFSNISRNVLHVCSVLHMIMNERKAKRYSICLCLFVPECPLQRIKRFFTIVITIVYVS